MSEYLTWRYDRLDVLYLKGQDGDGSSMAGHFVDYLRDRHAGSFPFRTAFEWCAGPGFIGFALLDAGLCSELVLSDINEEAVAAAQATVDRNGLKDRVRVCHGDNLDGLDRAERFDLVVSNPPNFFCLNPRHRFYDALKADLRPNDPGWRLHRRFYAEIPAFLNPGALLLIEEVDPFAEACFVRNVGDNQPLWGPEPFDLRPRPPVDDFIEMIEEAGLTYQTTVQLDHPEMDVHLMQSRFLPGEPAIRMQDRIQVFEQIGQGDDGRYQLIGLRDGRQQGQVNLTEDQLWVADLLELLNARRGQPQSAATLASDLDKPIDEIHSILEILRKLAWVHAPRTA